jgi:uncharacterized membrane protein YeiB
MVLLFLLGVINSFLFYGDILKDYALIGLLLYFLQTYQKISSVELGNSICPGIIELVLDRL